MWQSTAATKSISLWRTPKHQHRGYGFLTLSLRAKSPRRLSMSGSCPQPSSCSLSNRAWCSLSRRERELPAPLPLALALGGRDGDMSHRRIRLGAMPVPLPGLNVHDIADGHFALLMLRGDDATTRRDDQN